eukprot:scaffold3953_cov146-Skeletonema_menzelii.AAC.12
MAISETSKIRSIVTMAMTLSYDYHEKLRSCHDLSHQSLFVLIVFWRRLLAAAAGRTLLQRTWRTTSRHSNNNIRSYQMHRA